MSQAPSLTQFAILCGVIPVADIEYQLKTKSGSIHKPREDAFTEPLKL